jgi:hypothetical protein
MGENVLLAVALQLWALAHAAAADANRSAWLIVIGAPTDRLEDIFALAAQADSLVQLHAFHDEAEAAEFCGRYVPPGSLEEARLRTVANIDGALAQVPARRAVFVRASSTRSSAHLLVKQLSARRRAIAVHASQLPTVLDYCGSHGGAPASVCFLVLGEPRPEPVVTRLSNLYLARRIGLSFLDELGLIIACDGYVGVRDHNALIAADAGLPCLLHGDLIADFGCRIRCAPLTAEGLGRWLGGYAEVTTDLECAAVQSA